jgi:hypothetical protein
MLLALAVGCGSPSDSPANGADAVVFTDIADTAKTDDSGTTDTLEEGDTSVTEEVLDTADEGVDSNVPDISDSQPDTADPPADTDSPPPDKPTWWECRRAAAKQEMTEELLTNCDALFSSNPEKRTYGIRWVIKDPELDSEAWIASRLSTLNNFFESANFSFFTRSKIVVQNSAISDPANGAKYTLEALTTDTAQHFPSALSSSQGVLEGLKSKLLETGVAKGAVDNLTLDKVLDARAYMGIIARARPTVIHVIATPLLNGTKTGGLSSGPGGSAAARRGSVVALHTAEKLSKLVIAHETGHFFGLVHPHAQLEAKSAEAPATIETVIKTPQYTADELIAILEKELGGALEGAFELQFPHWNAVQSTTLKAFDKYRIAVNRFWLAKVNYYRYLDNEPVGYKNLLAFVTDLQSGNPIYYKNFIAPGAGNNCSWTGETQGFVCKIGSPSATYQGFHPMLAGSILLDGGKRANIMTYIAKTMSKDAQKEDFVRFSAEAVEVMKLHANTPVRLMLRNHAL